MNITVNSNIQSIAHASTISSMVNQLNIEPRGIAVALNNTVIPQLNWNNTTLKENDTIIIIKATQGG